MPDAALLFSGDYARAGSDLVLTGSEGAKFVVAGYFDTDNPPNLISPDGAMLTGDVVSALAGPQFPGQYAQAASSDAQGAEPIGKVQSIEGSATVVRANGVTETLEAGDPVFQGDVVMTGAGSKLGIGFVDGTVFSLSANARMVLNNLVYNPDGSDNSMLFSLVEGTFVFAAGKIAPTGDMKINTPVATMGIRGTSGVVEIEAANGPTNFKLIPDPRDGHEGSYVLYNLDTGEPMGLVDGTGSVWRLTSADGTVTTFPKSEDDLLQDAEAISNINSVYNSWTNSPDGPQAGPDGNPPSSGGLDTTPPQNNNQNENNNDNNNNEDNTPPDDDTEQEESGLPPQPPDFDDLPPLDEIAEDEGVNVINGTEFNDNDGVGEDDRPEIFGTDGDDIIFGHAGDDKITALAGDDEVYGGTGDDEVIAGTGEGDDHYDGEEGTDTISYTSAINGVVINLVDSTVTGVDVGFDTIASLERFVTSDEGSDTLIVGPLQVSQNFTWYAGDGEGVDTVLFQGAFDVDTANFAGDIEGLEVVDLNDTDANTLTISVDDFLNHDSKQIDALQIRGTNQDTVNLTNLIPPDPGNGYPGGIYEGTWELVTNSPEGFPETPSGFVAWQFVDTNNQVLAVAHIEQGVQVFPQINHAPVANDDAVATDEDTVLNGNLFADNGNGADYDPDGDAFTVTGVNGSAANVGSQITLASGAILTVNGDGTFSYDPNGAFDQLNDGQSDTDSFTYAISDGSGGTDAATATVTIDGISPLLTANFESFENGFEQNDWTVLNGVITGSNSTDGVNSALISTGFLNGGSGPASLLDISATTGVLTTELNELSTNGSDAGNLTEGGAISATFFAEADQTLSFDWFFTTQDYSPFNDIAFVSLNGEPYELFDVIASGNLSGTTTEGWNEFAMTFDQAGFYNLSFGVLDDADSIVDTSLLIDNIQLDSPSNPITLESGEGNDRLIGNSDDNILNGGSGNNTLTGNGGADKFVISGLNDGIDTITDYEGPNASGSPLDALDMSDLLAEAIHGELPEGNDLSQVIDHYVQAIEDGNGNVSIGVDLDGTAGSPGFEFTEVAVLQNVGTGVEVSIVIDDQQTTVESAAAGV